MAGLLLRVDLFAIEEDNERTRSTSTQPNRNPEFSFHIVLKAHGLSLDVSSKKAAFDFDSHCGCGSMLDRLR